jgi:predicted metalloprotease
MKRVLACLAAGAMAVGVSACGSSGGGSVFGHKDSGSATPIVSMPATPHPIGGTGAVPSSAAAPPASRAASGGPSDADVAEFVDEFKALQQTLESFWAEQIDGYQPPSRTIVFDGESDDPATFPTCGGERVSAQNGFYCPPDNTIILDADWMYEEYRSVGDSFLYVVLAHEYGHSAQANLPEADKPAEGDQEVQADCFSGAFLQSELQAGTITEDDGDEQEINQTLSSAAGDYGTTDAHGTLASRALAFEFGRKHGPGACLTVDDYRV